MIGTDQLSLSLRQVDDRVEDAVEGDVTANWEVIENHNAHLSNDGDAVESSGRKEHEQQVGGGTGTNGRWHGVLVTKDGVDLRPPGSLESGPQLISLLRHEHVVVVVQWRVDGVLQVLSRGLGGGESNAKHEHEESQVKFHL